MVNKLNKRLVLLICVIIKVHLEVEIENIWSVPIGDEGEKKKKNKKRKKKSNKDENIETVVRDNIVSEKVQ